MKNNKCIKNQDPILNDEKQIDGIGCILWGGFLITLSILAFAFIIFILKNADKIDTII